MKKPAPKKVRARAGPDKITILMTDPNHVATKQFVRIGRKVTKLDYSAGMWFGPKVYTVASIKQLSDWLSVFEKFPALFAIRGMPVRSVSKPTWVRRTKENFVTPPLGHHWLLIDLDKIALPRRLSLRRSVHAVCEYLITLLPPEFHNASYHWQLSSSAGMGKASTVSMHLWFWLREPATDAALKAWGKAVNTAAGMKLIDTALFNDVQAHYVAAPVFDGVRNPFPVRSGLTSKGTNSVDLQLPPPPKPQARSPIARRAELSSGGFERILGLIGDHAGGEGFHNPIIRAAASYVATYGGDATDVEDLYEIIRAKVLAADRSHHDGSYVEHMASREHIVSAIETAIPKYGKDDSPRRKSRRIEDISPHFSGAQETVKKASKQLDDAIGKFVG